MVIMTNLLLRDLLSTDYYFVIIVSIHDQPVCCLYYRCEHENCRIELLHNAKESHCFMEVGECVEALSSDVVMEEVDVLPPYITKHPGFASLCLDKWSFRLTATKLKTRKKQQYRQTSTEDW